jgi:hypothetical protein
LLDPFSKWQTRIDTALRILIPWTFDFRHCLPDDSFLANLRTPFPVKDHSTEMNSEQRRGSSSPLKVPRLFRSPLLFAQISNLKIIMYTHLSNFVRRPSNSILAALKRQFWARRISANQELDNLPNKPEHYHP